MEQSYGPVGHSQKATYMWHLGDNDCILFKYPLVPYFSNCVSSNESGNPLLMLVVYTLIIINIYKKKLIYL